MSNQWYVIQIYPQLEETAARNLRQQGFESFFPRLATKVEHDEITESVPLFKGYGFVLTDIERDRWTSINYTRGVSHLLPKRSLIPLPISTEFIEDLQQQSPIVSEKLTDVFSGLCPGMTVRIVKGVLEGHIGEVVIRRGQFLEVLLKSVKYVRNPLILADHLQVIKEALV